MRYSNPPKATSRPCLPSVEQLDDRVLLSAAVVGQTGGDGGDSNGGGVAGEPTAVERDFTSLLDAELAALKLAGDAQEKVSPIFIKLGQEFFKIDSLLLTSL